MEIQSHLSLLIPSDHANEFFIATEHNSSGKRTIAYLSGRYHSQLIDAYNRVLSSVQRQPLQESAHLNTSV